MVFAVCVSKKVVSKELLSNKWDCRVHMYTVVVVNMELVSDRLAAYPVGSAICHR